MSNPKNEEFLKQLNKPQPPPRDEDEDFDHDRPLTWKDKSPEDYEGWA